MNQMSQDGFGEHFLASHQGQHFSQEMDHRSGLLALQLPQPVTHLPQRPTRVGNRRARKIPKFVRALYQILSSDQYTDMISWTPDGEAFIIIKDRINDLSRLVLPKYFKHSNYGSFVRQLNMYNFVKLRLKIISDHQAYESDNDIFKNQHFTRNNVEQFNVIQRRSVLRTSKINQYALIQANAPVEPMIYESNGEQDMVIFQNYSDSNNLLSRVLSSLGSQKEESRLHLLKDEQVDLEDKCLNLYKQNRSIKEQINGLYNRINTEANKKNKIIDQIINYISYVCSESMDQDSGDEYSRQEPAQQSTREIQLESVLKFIKNGKGSSNGFQSLQNLFSKKEIEKFFERYSFLINSQTSLSRNKNKVIPLSYEQPKHKQSVALEDYFPDEPFPWSEKNDY